MANHVSVTNKNTKQNVNPGIKLAQYNEILALLQGTKTINSGMEHQVDQLAANFNLLTQPPNGKNPRNLSLHISSNGL